jgi:hypothetical protein
LRPSIFTYIYPVALYPDWAAHHHRLTFGFFCSLLTQLPCLWPPLTGSMVVPTMTPYPILFNQTLESLRRIGARGGCAHARNWRLRQRTTPGRLALTSAQPALETAAEAIARLDAQFPWLRNAERPRSRR